MSMLRMRPPSTDEVRARINLLVDGFESDSDWARKSVELAEATTYGDLVQHHPVAARLCAVQTGVVWPALQVEPGTRRISDVFPAIRSDDPVEVFDLTMDGEESFEASGPVSDFDPLNSAPFASVLHASFWYSLVAIPGEPIVAWPVVECTPEGPESLSVVAIDADHLMHEWFCRDGPYHLSPFRGIDDEEAEAAIALASVVFGISAPDAFAALEVERAGRMPGSELATYIDPELLQPLMSLVIEPD